jgi:hypothetical protein
MYTISTAHSAQNIFSIHSSYYVANAHLIPLMYRHALTEGTQGYVSSIRS